MTLYANFADIPAGMWRWPDFQPSEIACRGTGSILELISKVGSYVVGAKLCMFGMGFFSKHVSQRGLLIGVVAGFWGSDWAAVTGPKWAPMSAEYWFGTNIIGQDIFSRSLYSTRTAFEVGFVVALGATFIGAVLGAIAGFFSATWIDEVVIWCPHCNVEVSREYPVPVSNFVQ